MALTRRNLLGCLAVAGLDFLMPQSSVEAAASPFAEQQRDAPNANSCPFRLAVINDEITQDFEAACRIAAQDFGLQWIELRSMWNKNVTALDAKEIADAKKILAAHRLRVTDIASPLFKTDWPGAPKSGQGGTPGEFHADVDPAAQDKLLEHCIFLTKSFETDRIRCFDFWRIDDPRPYRKAINTKLQQAAERCAKDNIILLLENEMTCNTATGEEAAAVLKAIPNRNFMLNWDPGNAAAFAGTPYADGYNVLPKDRIGHCHCKDVVRKPDHKYEWAPVGGGMVDWVGQLEALQRDGFRYGLSLETHWDGGGTPEKSTRISMQGLQKALTQAGAACTRA